MFTRNICAVAELTFSCKTLLLGKIRGPVCNVRYHLRNSLPPRLQPDLNKKYHIQNEPLHTGKISPASINGCFIWEYGHLQYHPFTIFKKSNSWYARHARAQKKTTPKYLIPATGSLWQRWSSEYHNDKLFYQILAANVLVYGMWHVPSLEPTMYKYFCSNAGRIALLPMVLSTFSHHSLLHLAANMYVLHSFMPPAEASLGKGQFLAMYLSAGVASGLASVLYKSLVPSFHLPGLSLGASGAIMAVVAFVCVQQPRTKLGIMLLPPQFNFTAGTGIKVLMSMDLAGVLFGWTYLDHAAHLGGALFGLAWFKYGGRIWGKRHKFLHYFQNLRKKN